MKPAAPIGLNITNVTTDCITVVWSPPPNEDREIFRYTVQVNEKGINTTNNTFILWCELDPETEYTIQVLATDITSDISSSYSNSIRASTGIGLPEGVLNVFGRYTVVRDRLYVNWERPNFSNGIIRNYTIMWSSVFTSSECNLLLGSSFIEQVTDTSSLTLNVDKAPGLDVNTESFLLCVAAETLAGRGEWNYTIVTADGIIRTNSLTDDNGSGSNTALIIVLTVAVLAIIAAVVISAIFGIVCYIRKRTSANERESSPSQRANGDISKSSPKHSGFLKGYKNKPKATRTPDRDNTQSIRSTAPILKDD